MVRVFSRCPRWSTSSFLLTSLKIYYILDPNLSALPKPQEYESATVKTTRVKHEEYHIVHLSCVIHTIEPI